jgi:hypothetical protein
MSVSPARSSSRKLSRRLATFVTVAAVSLGIALAGAPVAQAMGWDWPDSIDFTDPRGIAFDSAQQKLYVADRTTQDISTVIEDGTVTPVIHTWGQLMTVAVTADGDVLFTQDSDPHIYRVDSSELGGTLLTLQSSDVGTLVTVEHTASDPYIYGLAVAPDGTIYYSQNSDKAIYGLRGGVATLLFHTADDPSAVMLSPLNVLYAVDASRALYSVIPPDLATLGPVVPNTTGSLAFDVSGMAFIDLSAYYYSNMDQVIRVGGNPHLVMGVPTISGTTTVDSTLTVNPGTWSANTTFDYQWIRDDVDIDGATLSTYSLTSADLGATISVRVTGNNDDTNPAISTATATTNAAVIASALGSGPAAVVLESTSVKALASTGFDAAPLGLLSFGLIVAGAAALMIRRRTMA